jgi:hypothetical protein
MARKPGRLVPSGDGGNDGKRVGGADGGGLLGGQVADVFVVQIQVNKSAHFALRGEEMFAQFGMRPGEGFGDVGALISTESWPAASGAKEWG